MIAPAPLATAGGLAQEGLAPMHQERISLGFCECGCGKQTWVATKDCAALGWVKGQPVRYVKGHHSRVDAYEVDRATGCWIWQGYISEYGYGVLNLNGTRQFAHRAYYERYVGPIPAGLTIDHVKARGCTSRACVNPAHLEPVTRGENVLRGDTTPGINSRKTHCPNGHPLEGENLYECRGRRQCRICRKAHRKVYRERWGRYGRSQNREDAS